MTDCAKSSNSGRRHCCKLKFSHFGKRVLALLHWQSKFAILLLNGFMNRHLSGGIVLAAWFCFTKSAPSRHSLRSALFANAKSHRLRLSLRATFGVEPQGVLIPLEYKKARKCSCLQAFLNGGRGGTRTHDQRFRKPLLYPLSYTPIFFKDFFYTLFFSSIKKIF